MKKDSGGYTERVVILRRTLAAADGTGEQIESWAEPEAGSGVHFAKVEASASSESLDANRQSATTRTLRFRHAVTLDAVDRVRLKASGEEYAVTGVHSEAAPWGGTQTVCTLIG